MLHTWARCVSGEEVSTGRFQWSLCLEVSELSCLFCTEEEADKRVARALLSHLPHMRASLSFPGLRNT